MVLCTGADCLIPTRVYYKGVGKFQGVLKRWYKNQSPEATKMSSPGGSRDEEQQSYYNLEGGRAGKSSFLEQTLFSAVGTATYRRRSWEQRLHFHVLLVFPVLSCPWLFPCGWLSWLRMRKIGSEPYRGGELASLFSASACRLLLSNI